MAEVDFSNLLSTAVGTSKRPPVKPAGTYHAVISGYKFDRSSKKQTPFCQFSFSNIQPGEDIDLEMLKDSEGEPIDLSKWKPTSEFYLTPEAMWRLDEFLKELLPNSVGRSKNEVLPETRGMPVLLTVSMHATDDGKGFYNRVDSVTAAP